MKGLSQIASAAMLLAIAVALAGIYAEWAPNYAQGLLEGALNDTQHDRRCGNAALSIRNPEYDRTGGTVEFEVENTGTIRFTESIVIGAYNDTVTNTTLIDGLEVEESVTARIYSAKVPEYVAVLSSEDCPSLTAKETLIQVKR